MGGEIYFGRNGEIWGGIDSRGWISRNRLCVLAFAAATTTGLPLYDWVLLHHPRHLRALPPDIAILGLLFLALSLVSLGLLIRNPIQARLDARQRRREAWQELDGKPLPPRIVCTALPVPRQSPSPAHFSKDLPDYCKALLGSGEKEKGQRHTLQPH